MARQSMVLVSLLALCGLAHAQSYALLATGASRVGRDCAGAIVCDTRGTAYKFALGQRLGEDMSAEIGVIDFGRSRVSSASSSLSLTGMGIGGGIALRHEVAPGWFLTGRIGLLAMDARVTSVSAVSFFAGSQRSLSLLGGLGAGYRIHPNMTFDVSLDASRIKFNRSAIDASSGVQAVLIGATLDF